MERNRTANDCRGVPARSIRSRSRRLSLDRMRAQRFVILALICSTVAANTFAAPPSYPVITGPELLQVFIRPRPPEYPFEARGKDWSGRGVYRAFVTPQGKVRRVIVLHSTGHSVLDDSVIRAALQWRAKPGRPKEVDFPIIFVAPPRGVPGSFGRH
jgi:TonB family protein